MIRTIASILNLITLVCYLVAAAALAYGSLQVGVICMLMGQFVEFAHRYCITDLEG